MVDVDEGNLQDSDRQQCHQHHGAAGHAGRQLEVSHPTLQALSCHIVKAPET